MSDSKTEALRREAIEAGDHRMAEICEAALAGDESASIEVARVIHEAQEAAQ